MAKAEQIKKLISSFGRADDFRKAAQAIIETEHRKGHIPLARTLQRMLDANVLDPHSPEATPLTRLDALADPAAEFLDNAAVERGLSDIILSPEAHNGFTRVLKEQKHRDELKRHQLPIRSKVLLCGPPGCGKTLGAEVLARELGLPLLSIKLDVVISSLLGQTATNLRRMFEYAARKPSVLFIDEFDALARTRDDAYEHNELRRVVNSLLLLIDRYQSRGLLVAATNLETALDTAIWRRFDEVVMLDNPATADIESMLKLQFKNFAIKFDLEKQIPKLNGLSFAEIERVALDAIKSAVLKKRKSVSETEFAAALKQETRRQSLSGSGKLKSVRQ